MLSGKRLKERLKAGEVVLGPFAILNAPGLIEAMGYAGFDFVIIDTEHGPLSIESAENLTRAADSVGIAPIIRVTENEAGLILRALDIGSAGVEIPQISDKSDAVKAVINSKYVPIGDRGLSPFIRATAYFSKAGPDYTRRANEESVVVIHVEGERGIKNIDEILTVDGLDVIFLGPYDISQSVGLPGQVDHPRVVSLMTEASEKAKKADKVLGSYARDVEMAKRLIQMGVQYMSVCVDATIFLQACERIVREVKDR